MYYTNPKIKKNVTNHGCHSFQSNSIGSRIGAAGQSLERKPPVETRRLSIRNSQHTDNMSNYT